MEAGICNACNAPVLEQAVFCYNCGEQVKCTQCRELLIPGAKHCISCGAAVTSVKKPEQELNLNKIKFRENKDERWYEITFTNDVGKEIKEVVADILKNKIGPEVKAESLEENLSVPQEENKTFKLQETLLQKPLSATSLPNVNSPTAVDSPEEIIPYPHLNDLDVRLSCTENEWLLIYAFYFSGYGNNTFAKEPIWQMYKDKRLTETRFKNLGTNWKSLFKKYLSTVKDNEFTFTSQGLAKVKSLLFSEPEKQKFTRLAARPAVVNGREPLTRRNPVNNRKVITGNHAPDEFDVYRNNLKISLEEFFNQKQPGNSNPNRIATIAYYITKINHQEYFTEGNIDFAYRILNLGGKPAHLRQIIINLKNERIWFKKVIDQNTTAWRLTRQGEIFVEEKL